MIVSAQSQIESLLKAEGSPCLTFYLPVQEVGAETKQGSVILKKLLREAEERLAATDLRPQDIQKLLEPIQDLTQDPLFWQHQLQGLALYRSQDRFEQWKLPIEVKAQIAVTDRFVLRPVLPMLVEDGAFYLLALGRGDTKLFRCSRLAEKELKIPGLPHSLQEIYEQYESEKQLHYHSSSSSPGKGQGSIYHGGAESLKDNEKKRIEEYFRQIDSHLAQADLESKTPLVLACVDYLVPIYRSVSHAARLVDEHISGSADLNRPDLLRQKAWDLVRPIFARPQQKALKACEDLFGSKRVLTDIRLILAAAAHGRVDTLFVPKEVKITGFYDAEKGTLQKDDATEADDLLDLAARMTLQSSGRVYVPAEDEMPGQAACLAMLRY